MRRVFDVSVAIAGLALSAPVLGLAALAIKAESPGPVVFSQTRVGRYRAPITVRKLRTMVPDSKGSQITAGGDARITRVGRFLRKTKLDELPQLWNVLLGEMSIVGPRPEVPRYVANYRPEWERLFDVRPGLTDLASLTFRDEESLLSRALDHERAYREVIMPLKLGLAVEGIQHDSLRYDLHIVARTLAALVNIGNAKRRQVLQVAQQQIERLNREVP